MNFLDKYKKELLFLFFLLIFFLVFFMNQACVPDGSSVCFDEALEVFRLEEDFSLQVQVETEEVKQAFEEKWFELYPDLIDHVELFVAEKQTIQDLQTENKFDIVYTSLNNAAYFRDDFFDLGKDSRDYFGSRIPKLLEDAMNEGAYYFIPNTVEGWYFVYNESMAQKLGISLKKESFSSLPIAFDSWEKIRELSIQYGEEFESIFPLNFIDQEAFYPFLTSGQWTLNFKHSNNDLAFMSREFAEGLEFIEFLAEFDYGSDLMDWDYVNAPLEGRSLFSIGHTSLNLENNSEDRLKMASFPRFRDHHQAGLAEVNGYLVSAETSYPSASAEVLRVLRSPEVLRAYEKQIVVYHRNYIDELLQDQEYKDKVLSFNFHDSPSILAYESNPKILLRNFYFEENLMDLLYDLFNGQATIDETQVRIQDRFEKWKSDKEGA